jgi:hypothetical protein
MICDHYEHTLLELAATGAEPDPELHVHLQVCSFCRSTLENDRNLFASIDSCLRSSANAEIPSSFIPTTRARIQQESAATRAIAPVTNRLLWVSALAGAAIILFIFTHRDRRAKSLSTDEQLVTQQTPSPVARQSTATKPSQGTAPQVTLALGNSFVGETKITRETKSVQTERNPEIIVPPDQEILLARYADRWSRHHHSSPTLLAVIDPERTDPLQVQLIQIAELDVKPLADQREYDLGQK